MRSPRDDRGAIAPIVAILLVILIPLTALVVDIGQARVARADMQSLADVTALDLARLMDGQKTVAQLEADQSSVVTTAKGRNKTFGDDPRVDVTWGDLSSTGDFVPLASGVPSAVKVEASTSVTFGLMPGTGEPSRTAVATNREATVCFSVGTRTLSLDTSESALSPLLDNILRIKLDAVGYDGIASLKDVSVPLLGLAAELEAGTVDGLLATEVGLGPLSIAVAKVLENQGDVLSANVLRAIDVGATELTVQIGELVNLDTSQGGAALTGDINVLDLLAAAILVSNGDSAVDTGIDIAGMSVEAVIIQTPQTACGINATARSAQVQVRVKVPVEFLGVSAFLGLEVTAGDGSATLSGTSCGPAKATFNASTAAARVRPLPGETANLEFVLSLGKIPLLGPVVGLLRLAGINGIGFQVAIEAAVGATGRPVEVTYPLENLPDRTLVPPGGVGSFLDLSDLDIGLASGQGVVVDILGALLNPVLTAVLEIVRVVVTVVLDRILTEVLNPVFELLGIRLGIAELDVHGRPVCDAVRLSW